MSTLTSTRTVFAVSPPAAALLRRLMYEGWRTARWLWPLSLVVAVVVGAVIARFTPVTDSIWENASQWPRWYLFAIAIAMVTTFLPLAVAHGVTRRTALRSGAVAAGLTSLLWAGFMTAGHVAEGLIYEQLGWSPRFTGPHLFDGSYDVLPMLVEYILVFLAYLGAGALIGAFYYRFGAVLGTLLIPIGLLPAVAIELVLSTGWIGAWLQESLSTAPPPVPGLLVAAAVVLALTGTAIQLVLRDVPIHSKK